MWRLKWRSFIFSQRTRVSIFIYCLNNLLPLVTDADISVPTNPIAVNAIERLATVSPNTFLNTNLSKPKHRQRNAAIRVNVPAQEWIILVKTVFFVYKLMAPPMRLMKVRIIAMRPGTRQSKVFFKHKLLACRYLPCRLPRTETLGKTWRIKSQARHVV